MIQTPEDLIKLVNRIRSARCVALDTEFVWERTYYPRLGIVQAALPGGQCELIDAAALDLAPLGEALADPAVEKILHDSQQDLTILRRVSGSMPLNIFDTRSAAGFTGLPATISLQELLSSLLGIQLTKTETRTNWLKRPLSEKQVEYALDDVRHLIEARTLLAERARTLGNEQRLIEELRATDNPALYEDRNPLMQYERVKGCGKLRGHKLAVLRELAAWREDEARRRDLPREHVVPDSALMAIAQAMPQSVESLRAIPGVSQGIGQRYGEVFMERVTAGIDVPKRLCPRMGPRHRRANIHPLVDSAFAFIKERCEIACIDSGLVVTRGELTSLAHNTQGAQESGEFRLLRGWRAEFVGNDVLALLTQ